MKLKDRGNAYEIPTSIHSDSDREHQPKQQLIYRGSIYKYTPRPAMVREALDPKAPTVALIYRGVTFERQIRSLKPDRVPRIINWRYRTVGAGC
jgi:hypothetical protein